MNLSITFYHLREAITHWTSFKTTYCRHPELACPVPNGTGDSGSGQIPGQAWNDV